MPMLAPVARCEVAFAEDLETSSARCIAHARVGMGRAMPMLGSGINISACGIALAPVEMRGALPMLMSSSTGGGGFPEAKSRLGLKPCRVACAILLLRLIRGLECGVFGWLW